MTLDAAAVDLPARLGGLDVAAGIGRHVHHDGPGAHPLDHRPRDEHRRGPARYRRRGDHDVRRGHLVGEGLTLALQLLGAELPRVAPLTLCRARTKVDERGPQALRLLTGRRPHVVGADDGAQAPGRGDGLEPGHPRPHHEHLGRRHRPGRRHEHGEELAKGLGSRQRGSIARDRRLGREGVHALGTADPRQQVEAEDRAAPPSEDLERFDGVGRLQEAELRRPLRHETGLLGGRRIDLCDDGGLGQRLSETRGDSGAGFHVAGVGKVRCRPRP